MYVGAGGNAGLSSSMNSAAKTFPERTRATITGIVISGFGLSAFVFSLLAHRVFPGDTSSFLLVLALGTSFPMIVGFFLVRPIPLPVEELMVVHAETTEEFQSHHHSRSATRHNNDSSTPLLSDESDSATEFVEETNARTMERSIEMSPTRSLSPRRRRPVPEDADRKVDRGSAMIKVPTNIHGRSMFKKFDFWLLFSFMSLREQTHYLYPLILIVYSEVSGTGIMCEWLLSYHYPFLPPDALLKSSITSDRYLKLYMRKTIRITMK